MCRGVLPPVARRLQFQAAGHGCLVPRQRTGEPPGVETCRRKGCCPGDRFATLNWGLWNDHLVFAVWVDRIPKGNYGTSMPGTKLDTGHWDQKYSVYFRDPPAVEVECRTTDGKGGSVTVNGKSYDSAQGAIFLVHSSSGEVKQLNRDGLSAKPGVQDNPPDVFLKLKADPEVKAFFARPKKAGGTGLIPSALQCAASRFGVRPHL